MTRSDTIHATVDKQTKEKAQGILHDLGMSMSEAIAVYFKQIVLHKGLPFEVKIPNQETVDTIKKAAKGIEVESFASVEELFEDLDS